MSTKLTVVALAMTVLSGNATASDLSTPEQAQALSKRAQAAVDKMGMDQAFAAFAAPDSGFKSKDLYVFCLDLDGRVLSHAANPALIGRNLRDLNQYGDEILQKMVAIVQASGEGWVSYKWPYPGSTEIRDKATYVMANQEGFFCGVGAYREGSADTRIAKSFKGGSPPR
jgi:cytochrome c